MGEDKGFYFLDSKMTERILNVLGDNFFPRSEGKVIHNQDVINLCDDLETEFCRQYQRREELKEGTGCPVCDQGQGSTTDNAVTPNWVKWEAHPPPTIKPERWEKEGAWRINFTIEKKV